MISEIPAVAWAFGGIGLTLGLCASFAVIIFKVFPLMRERDALQTKMEIQHQMQTQSLSSMDNQFKVSAQEALKTAHQSFLQLAQETFKKAQADGAYDLEKRQKAIDDLVKPVHQNLETLSKALEQVKATDQTLREDLRGLSRETAKLVTALRDPRAKGEWGEFILEGVLNKSGLIKGVHYDTQVHIKTNAGGAVRPDAVIYMQDGLNIIIDAKAPLAEITQQIETEMTEADYQALATNLAKQVRGHIKTLGRKDYWDHGDAQNGGTDFTVMFVPSEHIYSMALRADPQIVDFAASNSVIIASPTLLMSLLRVVSISWRQVELAKNAQEISKTGVELYKRLLTFTNHISKIGKNIESAMKGYNDAVGSLERSVLPAARKFKDLQPSSRLEDLSETSPLEQPRRLLSLTEEDTQQLQSVENAHDQKKSA